MHCHSGKVTRFLAVAAVLALAVALTALAACNITDDKGGNGGTLRPVGNSYTISFETGVQGVECDDIILTSSTQIILPDNLYRRGYEFAGWYIDEDYTTTLSDFLISNAVSENIVAYAKWEPVEYTLNISVNNPKAGYILDDGNEKIAEDGAEEEIAFTYGTDLSFTAVGDQTKSEYYSFMGWYDEDGNQVQGTNEYAFRAPAEDVRLQARWRGVQLKINFYYDLDSSDAETPDPVTDHCYGDTFIYLPELPETEIEGLSFGGWSYDKLGGTLAASGDGAFTDFEPDDSHLKPSYESGIVYELDLYAQWDKVESEFIFGSVENEYIVNGWHSDYYDEEPESLHIPASYANKAVVAINEGAFDEYTGKVFVPGSVTSIAEGAFSERTEVYFEADTDYQNVSESLITGIGTENIYFNIIAGLKAADVVQTFDYPMYVENGKGIYDTEINSEEEFIAVYQYCWLYNIGSLNLGVGAESSGTKVTFDFSESGLQSDEILKVVLGTTTEGVTQFEDSWVSTAIGSLGLKSNTASTYGWSYAPETSELTVFFKDLSEYNNDSYVASKKTEGGYCQLQAGAAFTKELSEDGSMRRFPIDDAPEYVVYNSEQLVYAVENGFKPRFGTLSESAVKHEKDALESAKDVWWRAREILRGINSSDDSDLEKLLAIHDYIALNNIYDSALYKLSEGENVDAAALYEDSEDEGVDAAALSGYRGFNLEGVFIDGKAVCDGITKAFMLMARIEGFECVRITGKNSGGVGHAWNKVKLDGKWYNVDVTGDDSLTTISSDSEKKVVETLSHDKFLVSDAFLEEKGYVEDDYGFIDAASGNYDFYKKLSVTNLYDLYIESEEEMEAVAEEALEDARAYFKENEAAEYFTFDVYWAAAGYFTLGIDIIYGLITPSGTNDANEQGVYVIILERGNVMK